MVPLVIAQGCTYIWNYIHHGDGQIRGRFSRPMDIATLPAVNRRLEDEKNVVGRRILGEH